MKLLTLLMLPLFLLCGFSFEADACLQPAGRRFVGEPIDVNTLSVQEFIKKFNSHQDQAYWSAVLSKLEKQNREDPVLKFASSNNFAVALVHLGQIKEAIALLEELEKESPGEYFTAANLGTAYELNGKNQKALEWIKESVKRNPGSHFGTEWLHVKILETKLAMEHDRDWLKHHSVLETNFDITDKQPSSEIFASDYLGQKKSLNEIENALVYQPHERLEFGKPPEPVVADLLNDLSKSFAILRTPEHVKAVNDLALQYGIRDISPKTSINNSSGDYLLYGASSIVMLILAAIAYSFIRKRNLQQ